MLAQWNIKSVTKTVSINRTLTATVLAIVMHLAGALGILYWRRDWFLMLTPFNLLVMFFLLIWTLPEKNKTIYWFFILAFSLGVGSEMIGVKTGLFFGQYQYGKIMGFSFNGVPMLIGIYWFIIVYACGMLALKILDIFSNSAMRMGAFTKWSAGFFIIGGALLATSFDYIMEPAATKLGFWSWENDSIPLLNYLSWFLVSICMLFFSRSVKLKHHSFAVNLLLIQAFFFLLLR